MVQITPSGRRRLCSVAASYASTCAILLTLGVLLRSSYVAVNFENLQVENPHFAIVLFN